MAIYIYFTSIIIFSFAVLFLIYDLIKGQMLIKESNKRLFELRDKIEKLEQEYKELEDHQCKIEEQINLIDEINLLKMENIRLKGFIEELKDNVQK